MNEPEECIFIGDSMENDVRGAVKSGMHGIWYCPMDIIENPEVPWIRSYLDCLKDSEIRFSKNLII
ncbi:MAG: HAD hydrolase-like protein [Lachnospiraceae bacterium]